MQTQGKIRLFLIRSRETTCKQWNLYPQAGVNKSFFQWKTGDFRLDFGEGNAGRFFILFWFSFLR
jgi:hypothetical protein